MIYVAQGQKPPIERQLELELKVWEFSVSAIPDQHLEECFKRAMGNKRDDYILRASAVMREWDVYAEELLARARANEEKSTYLQLNPGKKTYYGIEPWKRKHNLPPEWKPQQGAYTPESDLYGVPSPLDGRIDPPGPDIARDPSWYERTKKPWELYPNQLRPDVQQVNGVEFIWYFDICPGADCRGYILEHYGPGGAWYRAVICPDHPGRFNGVVEKLATVPVVARATTGERPGAEAFTREMWQRMAKPTPEEDAAIRAAFAKPAPAQEEDDNDLPF